MTQYLRSPFNSITVHKYFSLRILLSFVFESMNFFLVLCQCCCIIISNCKSEEVYELVYNLRGVMRQVEENSRIINLSDLYGAQVQIFESQTHGGKYKIDSKVGDTNLKTVRTFTSDQISVKLLCGNLLKIYVNDERPDHLLLFFIDDENARSFYELMNPESALTEEAVYEANSLDVYDPHRRTTDRKLGPATLYQNRFRVGSEKDKIFIVKLRPTGLPFLYVQRDQFNVSVRRGEIHFSINNRTDWIYIMNFDDNVAVFEAIWRFSGDP